MPAAAAPAASATPAAPATPAATTTPAAAPAAPASAQPLSAQGKPNLTSAFDALDKIIDPAPRTPTATADKTGDEPADETPAPEPGKDGKPPETKPPQQGQTPEKPPKAATLREAKDRAEAQVKTLSQELEKLKAEAAKPKDHPELKSITEERDNLRKRLDEVESELRYSNYERTSEFKEKYEAPFVQAYQSGAEKAKSLKIPERKDPNTDAVIQAARQGTEEDWQEFMSISDDDKAADFAQDRFGHKAPLMLYHREQVRERNAARNRAVDEYRAKGSEREKQMSEQSQREAKEIADLFAAENKAAAEKYPWFKPVEGDEKANTLLTNGMNDADRAFDMKHMATLPKEQRARIWSAIRNKAGAFDRVVYDSVQLKKQVSELQAKLKEYEESEPGSGEGQRRDKRPEKKPMDNAFDQIDRMAGLTS